MLLCGGSIRWDYEDLWHEDDGWGKHIAKHGARISTEDHTFFGLSPP